MKKGRHFLRAISGVAHAFRNRLTLRIHLAIAGAVVFSGTFFRVNAVEWCIIAICIGAVLSAEMFNASLEKSFEETAAESFSSDSSPLDVAAGAVLMVCLFTAIIGCIIFIPYITERIR